ncbi:PTS sugar transporter subunit IIB [Escherichia coli]|uniref:PTS sugar transporter subunit IIB n=1 Tax=Escherichia coli TaxID=562 RepID=UPI001D18430B|nr:PTS sugar transporter subunit IIB [Escherichia coli]MCC4137000.1 PTS sugar transporter subunit IIB [Escherichia coli]MCC4160508.1 PTS sugar transporter subunit IIB [Escherichia coli]MCV4397095.1 PTS sugar transporter subunit IIB [Escherichia coli]MCY0097099.1 PTS sugar transporter subunit IIB [Escherichia coli]
MLSQIQRFGGAMFTPVLLFPFAGIVVGLAILLQNPMFVGESLTDPNSLFAQIVHIIEEGGWTVFRNMPLIFAVGLPIGLAKQAQGRACLAVMVSFLTWNYFINAMGMTWGSYFGVDFTQDAVAGSGLTMMAGIKTLDTSIIGAIIISGIVTALHNRLFDKKLPVFLGIFQGTSYVVIIAFLFISPLLFAVHAVLAASMSTVMYLFGVVGNMGGGLIDQVLPQNWIPMFSNHADMMLTQIAIGLCFTLLYFVVFRTLILQFNMCTPGREDAEVKLYSKAEYKASRGQTTAAEPKKELDQAAGILQALGGVGNISSINNCATRLRIALHDMSQTLDDEVFKKLGAHGVFRSGDAIQVIIGLHVSQLREQLDSLINSHQSAENVAITEAV